MGRASCVALTPTGDMAGGSFAPMENSPGIQTIPGGGVPGAAFVSGMVGPKELYGTGTGDMLIMSRTAIAKLLAFWKVPWPITLPKAYEPAPCCAIAGCSSYPDLPG